MRFVLDELSGSPRISYQTASLGPYLTTNLVLFNVLCCRSALCSMTRQVHPATDIKRHLLAHI
jgi:hypothetical protein